MKATSIEASHLLPNFHDAVTSFCARLQEVTNRDLVVSVVVQTDFVSDLCFHCTGLLSDVGRNDLEWLAVEKAFERFVNVLFNAVFEAMTCDQIPFMRRYAGTMSVSA